MGGGSVEVRWRSGRPFGMRLAGDSLMVIWKAIWIETLEGLFDSDLDGGFGWMW
jgi:hypothetical protein